MITCQGVSKYYGHHQVLRNIDLKIQSGEIFGIIGKSGVGKSTLIRCLNGLEPIDAGLIDIDNHAVSKGSPKTLREVRHITGMIFQHFNLLESKTAYENIALPMLIQGMSREHIAHKVEELLAVVELSDKSSYYPAQLSGGQKQRIAIARALSVHPKVLLCDEATSALDVAATESILSLLKKINQLYHLTVVLITHDMGVVKRICHRVALMEHGTIQEVLPLSDVFSAEYSRIRPLLYEQLSPHLPPCLAEQITLVPNQRPLLRVLFQGDGATLPFISRMSRLLDVDINILLANIDRFDGITCGVLIVSLHADQPLLHAFMEHCAKARLYVELLGYVVDFKS